MLSSTHTLVASPALCPALRSEAVCPACSLRSPPRLLLSLYSSARLLLAPLAASPAARFARRWLLAAPPARSLRSHLLVLLTASLALPASPAPAFLARAPDPVRLSESLSGPEHPNFRGNRTRIITVVPIVGSLGRFTLRVSSLRAKTASSDALRS